MDLFTWLPFHIVYLQICLKFMHVSNVTCHFTILLYQFQHNFLCILRIYSCMSPADRGNFSSVLLLCLFSFLVVPITIYNMILNRNIRNGYPLLIPKVTGKDFSFASMIVMLPVTSSYVVCIVL